MINNAVPPAVPDNLVRQAIDAGGTTHRVIDWILCGPGELGDIAWSVDA
jgi:hypothetical protein